MNVYGTFTGRVHESQPALQELPKREGTNEARSTTINPALALPYGVDFASLEKRICALMAGTKYDVLCWHMSRPATHWVNGSIVHLYNMATSSDYGQPYTAIRWR